MKYDELKYRCPDISAAASAGRAITILREAEKVDAGFLAYLLIDSNLLILAGLRAQSPYNSFSPLMSAERWSMFESLLEKYGLLWVQENKRYDTEDSPIYSMLSPELIAGIPDAYRFLNKKDWPAPIELTPQGLYEWAFVIERRLASLMVKDQLPKKWLADWWAPHNLRFGMLLGYPGEAISSNLWADAYNLQDGRELPMETVSFGAREDYAAAVGYYIANDAAKIPEAAKHRMLWKEVLAIIRAEYNDKKLANFPDFVTERDAFTESEAHSIKF